MYYVYILKCENNSIYIGCTSNIKDRLKRHNDGEIKATKTKLPVQLITAVILSNKYTAYKLEKYFKTGSGRAFVKRHLI